MKLATDIKPRADGEVRVTSPSGTLYRFSASSDGVLVADVSSNDDIAWLLNTGAFYPDAESDIDRGLGMVTEDIPTRKRGRPRKE